MGTEPSQAWGVNYPFWEAPWINRENWVRWLNSTSYQFDFCFWLWGVGHSLIQVNFSADYSPIGCGGLPQQHRFHFVARDLCFPRIPMGSSIFDSPCVSKDMGHQHLVESDPLLQHRTNKFWGTFAFGGKQHVIENHAISFQIFQSSFRSTSKNHQIWWFSCCILRLRALVYLLDSLPARWRHLCGCRAALSEVVSTGQRSWGATDCVYFPYTCHCVPFETRSFKRSGYDCSRWDWARAVVVMLSWQVVLCDRHDNCNYIVLRAQCQDSDV